jgi:hypothetical protein
MFGRLRRAKHETAACAAGPWVCWTASRVFECVGPFLGSTKVFFAQKPFRNFPFPREGEGKRSSHSFLEEVVGSIPATPLTVALVL